MSNDLTFFERQKFQYYAPRKISLRNVGTLMKRDHSILSRELKKAGFTRDNYRADIAQQSYEKRKHKKRKGKMDKYPKLKEYVLEKLRDDWSPDIIAGKLKSEASIGITISHESIYQYIYEREGRYENLYSHLLQGRPKRQRRYGRKTKKSPILERKSIHERPALIETRERVGDWESDSVIFSKQKEILSVQMERKSRLARLTKIPDKTADSTLNALIRTAESVPNELFLTMTFDNGGENVKHTEIKKEYGIGTYFCDTYSAWQKGAVENLNKLVRRYLPKKTDISKLSQEDVYGIQEKLNNRPRKILNYLTPNEVFKKVVL